MFLEEFCVVLAIAVWAYERVTVKALGSGLCGYGASEELMEVSSGLRSAEGCGGDAVDVLIVEISDNEAFVVIVRSMTGEADGGGFWVGLLCEEVVRFFDGGSSACGGSLRLGDVDPEGEAEDEPSLSQSLCWFRLVNVTGSCLGLLALVTVQCDAEISTLMLSGPEGSNRIFTTG